MLLGKRVSVGACKVSLGWMIVYVYVAEPLTMGCVVINPLRAWAARVTVLGLCVCVCVSLASQPDFLRVGIIVMK